MKYDRTNGPPGIQVVVVSSEGIVFEGSRGFADPLGNEGQCPVTTHHQANLYSVTKLFTACCVLKLVDQGKLSLSTKARDVLPDPMKDLVNDCTIQQLLLHTASAPNPLPLSWVHGVDDEIDEEKMLLEVLRKYTLPPLSSCPSYRYSNVGYWILGAVIAHVCNKPMSAYSEICDELLFIGNLTPETKEIFGTKFSNNVPTAAGYVSRWSILAFAARLLAPNWIIGKSSKSWTRMELHHLNGASFGGIISTSHAVSSFLQCILKERILSPESLKLLFTPQNSEMTCGLHVRSHRGMPVYHKEGGGAGCHSSIHFRPNENLAACVIAGDAEFDVNGFLDDLLDSAADATASMVISRTKYVQVKGECVLHTKCYRSSVNDHKKVLADPVILIHGGPGVPDYLEPLAHLLLENNIASVVITFDQRGVGKSREAFKDQLSMDLMVDDIECIREAYDAKRIHLIGHSWGGILAQLYAMANPNTVSSLVLLSPSTASDASQWSNMEQKVLKSNLHKCGWFKFSLMGIFSLLMLIPGLANFAARRLFAQVMKNYYFDPATAPDPPPSFLAGISARACFASKKAFLRHVTEPMTVPDNILSLAIFGDEDIYGDDMIKKFGDRFPVDIVPNAGHLTWIDQPRALTRVLKGFFAKRLKE